jgi:large subunit ribosomal protein L21e
MVKAHHKGPRSKTRYAYKKSVRERGKPSVNKMMQKFEVGDFVHINVDSSVHNGMPHRRYQGKTGKVIGMQGDSYMLQVKSILATRKIIVHPAHLKKQELKE